MTNYRKVNWYEEELDDYYGDENDGRVFGIYTYDDEDRVDATWYTSEKERDFAYHLHSGIADRISNGDFDAKRLIRRKND